MMFLEFFIWGSWFVTLGTFLGNNLHASGAQIGNAFATQSLGAIIAPFIIGLIADRFFNAEKILGILHLAGAFFLYKMYTAADFSVFYPFVFGYMILYMPTLSLVNSISFKLLNNAEKEFSNIRVWGTIGWIVAGLLISFYFNWDSTENIQLGLLNNTFLMACIASFVLGIISFTLPPIPPKAYKLETTNIKSILGIDAIKLLKSRDFLIFFISSILICIPLAFYYQNANPFLSNIGLDNPTGKMTIGQISEVLFLLLLPIFFKKFGFKQTLALGMLAWAIRYILFAFGNAGASSWMLILSIALHGICYDFFFVSGQIYTNSKAGEHIKNSAQGLIAFATYGVGMLIGFHVAGLITDHYTSQNLVNWKMIWIIPAGIAFIVLLTFAALFKTKNN